MSQHDFDITPADANTGSTMRAAINAAIQALASISAGAAAPATTYAYQLWADTTTGLLKQRNAANDGWIVMCKLDGSQLQPTAGTAAAPAISTSGDTDTGVYFPSANTLGISAGGVQRVNVDATGVQIIGGIKTSNTEMVSSKGVGFYRGLNALALSQIVCTDTYGDDFAIQTSTDADPTFRSIMEWGRGRNYLNIKLGTTPAMVAEFTPTGVKIFGGITASGTVLVGTTVDAGTGKLQVVGDVAITGGITSTGDIKTGNTAMTYSKGMGFYRGNNALALSQVICTDTYGEDYAIQTSTEADPTFRSILEWGRGRNYVNIKLGAIPATVAEFTPTGLKITGDIAVSTKTPASATAAGVAGTITWDADYIYICTATNTWKRTAITTW